MCYHDVGPVVKYMRVTPSRPYLRGWPGDYARFSRFMAWRLRDDSVVLSQVGSVEIEWSALCHRIYLEFIVVLSVKLYQMDPRVGREINPVCLASGCCGVLC